MTIIVTVFFTELSSLIYLIIISLSYLYFHASNRFAQLEHDKDQACVNRLPAAGASLLSVEDKNSIKEHTSI